MPIHDYHCSGRGHDFETLVRSGAAPACPRCGSTGGLQRQVSRIAPAGTVAATVAGARRRAAREGHMSQYSAAERARLLK